MQMLRSVEGALLVSVGLAAALWVVTPISELAYQVFARRYDPIVGAVVSGILTVVLAVSGVWLIVAPWRLIRWYRGRFVSKTL